MLRDLLLLLYVAERNNIFFLASLRTLPTFCLFSSSLRPVNSLIVKKEIF